MSKFIGWAAAPGDKAPASAVWCGVRSLHASLRSRRLCWGYAEGHWAPFSDLCGWAVVESLLL